MSSYSEGLCNTAFFFAKREEEFCLSVFLIEIAGGENSRSASGEFNSNVGVSTSEASFLSLAGGESIDTEN